MVGASPNEDTLNGFFLPVEKQIEMVCQKISEDPNLQNGYIGMGFSQGGQFMRGIAEVCPQGMKKLISFGGQHQGIYGKLIYEDRSILLPFHHSSSLTVTF